MRRTLYSIGLGGALFAAGVFYGQIRPTLPPPALTGQVDRIVIDKSDREMVVYREGRALKRYGVALGFAPAGDKEREGDGKTPEGIYKIDRRNPNSSYHLSLGINYPLPEDRSRARAGGYSPGGDIFIHGQPKGITGLRWITEDWTLGCIAVSNAAMDELYPAIALGVEVEIRP
ncbi:L,D-transpeptidase family protein [Alphaproteobacteria bacterium KMM 3653]|uniref:L,D-transpeptidase family protein n=1 Tax=Harenicola maris TaxID=2841044 RepID=A0AAP2CTY6_9RHOB|nr:L,D-transpeptidase family protein [Harenicola maris]